MTLETKLSVDQDYVKSFSEKHQEPAWMSSLRLQALEKAEDLPMPKPDKTNISKWNLTNFQTAYSRKCTIWIIRRASRRSEITY